MGILSSIFGRRQRLDTLEEEKPNAPKPSLGSILKQLSSSTKVQGSVEEYVGVFNPRKIGVETYDLMRCDPDLAFGLAILRAPLINLPYSVECEDATVKAFLEAELDEWYRQLATAMSLALPFGWLAAEKVWEAGPKTITITDQAAGTSTTKTLPMAWSFRKFKALAHRTVNLLVDPEKDEWAGIEQVGGREGRKPVPVGPEKSVLWSFRKEEVFGRLTGFPVLKQSYEPWWWSAAMNLFANRYFERRADPSWKAFCDALVKDGSGKDVDGFEFVITQLLALKGGGVAAFPNKRDARGNRLFDAELVADDKRGDMFQERIAWLSTQKLRSLWITDKAGTSDGTGSLAMAEVHADTLSMMLEAIVSEWLGDVLNPQIIRPLVLYNFGPQVLEQTKPRVISSGLSASTRDLLSKVVLGLLTTEQMLKNGKTVTFAQMIDAKQVAKTFDLPLHSQDVLEDMADAMEEKKLEEERRMLEAGGGVPSPDDKGVESDLKKRGHLD